MDLTVITQEVAARLRASRARADLTLREAAKMSKVHYVSISRYEQGDKLPTLENLYKLADAYGVEAASLVPPNAIKSLPTVKKDKKS